MNYPDPTELTAAQKKAVADLKKAFSAAKRAKVYFYQVLDTVHALNGNLVDVVVTEDDSFRADCSLRDFHRPEEVCCRLINPFADDEHYVIFKDSVRKKVEGL